MNSNQTYVCLVLKNLAYMMNSNQTYVCLVLKNLAYMMNSNQSNCAHSKIWFNKLFAQLLAKLLYIYIK